MDEKFCIRKAFDTALSTIAKKIDTILDELKLRAKWFTPVEILRQGTSNGGKLLSLSNVKNPYKQGKPGVIEEGALADILLINGNPLEDLTLFHSPEENLALIMKDGKIYKSTLQQAIPSLDD